jgi:hypothetical protein
MGSHTGATHEMNSSVGGLVAQDLIQERSRPIDKPRCQRDFGATGAITPESAPKSCAGSERDVSVQVRDAPDSSPPVDRVSKLAYARRIHARSDFTRMWRLTVVIETAVRAIPITLDL